MNLMEKLTKAAKAGEMYNLDYLRDAWQEPRPRRLMGNETVYPPSPKAVKAIAEFAPLANYYAEDASTIDELRRGLAEYVGLEDAADWVTLGNGSLELIETLYRVFLEDGDEVLVPSPEYSVYVRRAKLFGANVVDVMPDRDFRYDLENFTRVLTPRTKMIVLTRPNNPTGDLVSRKLLEGLTARDCIVVVDEAYAQFARETVCDMLANHPNLVVLRTFSKAMGLAGVRLGFAVANPEIIGYLNRIRVPLNVSLIAKVAAQAALNDLAYIEGVTHKVIEARDRFVEELKRIPGIRPFPSAGNFVLIDCEGTRKAASEIQNHLREKGFMVRLFAGARGLPGDHYLRVSVGTPEDMRLVANEIKACAAA